MVNFTKLAATAKRLVEANGRSVSLIKDNRDPDNAAEPWRGTSTAPVGGQQGDTQAATAAFVPASGSGLGRLVQDATGQLATAFEQVCFVAADSVAGVDLEPFDRVVDGAVSWKIVARGRLQPASTPLLWILGLKR